MSENKCLRRAMAQAVRRQPLTEEERIAPLSVHVAFVVDKLSMLQLFSEFFGFPCQYHSTVALHSPIQGGTEPTDTFPNAPLSDWWGVDGVATRQKDRIGCHFETCLVTMEKWSLSHRTADVPVYCGTNSIVQIQRRLLQHFNVPRHGLIPSRNAILGWVRKFEDTGCVTVIAHGAPRTVRTEENVRRARENFERSRRRSARQQSRILGISKRSLG
jgi:hypothetical protein